MARSRQGSNVSTSAARKKPTASSRRRRRWPRHFVAAVASLLFVWLFWSTRPNWVPEMRLWKAVGDSSFLLLVGALAIGPLARLAPSTRRWIRWRRQLGIWFAITASVHALLILNGWAEWSLRRFLGYEFIPQLGREARLEPGFGLANLVGVTALVLTLVLAGTSSDRALRRLGGSAWTWLHRLSQTILILVLLHGGYFLYVHFTLSFHKEVPEPDWFRFPFVIIGLSVLGLQAAAFLKTMRRERDAKAA